MVNPFLLSVRALNSNLRVDTTVVSAAPLGQGEAEDLRRLGTDLVLTYTKKYNTLFQVDIASPKVKLATDDKTEFEKTLELGNLEAFKWLTSTSTVGAQYDPEDGAIYFNPLSRIQKYLDYVVAHEMAHHFQYRTNKFCMTVLKPYWKAIDQGMSPGDLGTFTLITFSEGLADWAAVKTCGNAPMGYVAAKEALLELDKAKGIDFVRRIFLDGTPSDLRAALQDIGVSLPEANPEVAKSD